MGGTTHLGIDVRAAGRRTASLGLLEPAICLPGSTTGAVSFISECGHLLGRARAHLYEQQAHLPVAGAAVPFAVRPSQIWQAGGAAAAIVYVRRRVMVAAPLLSGAPQHRSQRPQGFNNYTQSGAGRMASKYAPLCSPGLRRRSHRYRQRRRNSQRTDRCSRRSRGTCCTAAATPTTAGSIRPCGATSQHHLAAQPAAPPRRAPPRPSSSRPHHRPSSSAPTSAKVSPIQNSHTIQTRTTSSFLTIQILSNLSINHEIQHCKNSK